MNRTGSDNCKQSLVLTMNQGMQFLAGLADKVFLFCVSEISSHNSIGEGRAMESVIRKFVTLDTRYEHKREACMNKLKFYESSNMEDFFYQHDMQRLFEPREKTRKIICKASGPLIYESSRKVV